MFRIRRSTQAKTCSFIVYWREAARPGSCSTSISSLPSHPSSSAGSTISTSSFTKHERELTMGLLVTWRHLTLAAAIGAVVLVGGSSALAQSQPPAAAISPTTSTAGLILQESEGELRVRRPRGNNGVHGYGEHSSGEEDSPSSPSACRGDSFH